LTALDRFYRLEPREHFVRLVEPSGDIGAVHCLSQRGAEAGDLCEVSPKLGRRDCTRFQAGNGAEGHSEQSGQKALRKPVSLPHGAHIDQ
jgi:hypothetical protein